MANLKPLWGAVIAVFLAGLAGAAAADEAVHDIPIGSAGTATSVSISTFAWTAVPTTSSLARRSLLKVRNPYNNNKPVICTCSAASPSEAITIGDIEIGVGENPAIECDDNMKLYCVSLHTSAESINVKEYRQK